MMVAHYKRDVVDLHQELKTPLRDLRKDAVIRAQEDLPAGTNRCQGTCDGMSGRPAAKLQAKTCQSDNFGPVYPEMPGPGTLG